MATTKPIVELQAPSSSVSHRGDDLVLHYDPFFLTSRIGIEPTAKISPSSVPGGPSWKPARTGPLPCSRGLVSQMSYSLS